MSQKSLSEYVAQKMQKEAEDEPSRAWRRRAPPTSFTTLPNPWAGNTKSHRKQPLKL